MTRSARLTAADVWLRAAPPAASALIVAENLNAAPRAPARRVALDWLCGARNDAAPLRAAAAKFADTSALAAAGTDAERADGDGSRYLKTPGRSPVCWVVRSIPLALLRCWAGYEDATGLLPQQDAETGFAPQRAVFRPATAPVTAQKPAALPAAPGEALPQFAPMAALIVDTKAGFAGNCAKPDGGYVTDCRTLLARAACDREFLRHVKPITAGAHSPENPLRDEQAASLFKSATADAIFDAQICGYILAEQAGIASAAGTAFACVQHSAGAFAIVDAHRLRLIQKVTGADIVKVADATRPLALFKDGKPVAIVITINDPELSALFKRMLATSADPARAVPLNSGREPSQRRSA